MLMLDSLARFSGISLLAILAVLAWRARGTWRSAPFLLCACLSVASFLLSMTPQFYGLPDAVRDVFRFFAVPHLVCVWLFALSLFEPDFKMARRHWLVSIIYCVPLLLINYFGVAVLTATAPWLLHTATLFSVALMVHLVASTLRGRSDDLLEQRRTARIYFVLVVVFVAVVTALSDPIGLAYPGLDRGMIKSLVIWPAIVWGVFWMVDFDKDAINYRARPQPEPVLNQRDADLLQKLELLMSEGQAFKEPDLTIVALAARLGITQHRLRKLINEALGYQNFNEYLNHHRIDAIIKVFDDPKSNHLPILTIAMDWGYKSISPFNKAFRTKYDTTPSAFRRGAGGGGSV